MWAKRECGKSYYFYRMSTRNPRFPLPGSSGQNVTQNDSPRIGACLVLSESIGQFAVPILLRGKTLDRSTTKLDALIINGKTLKDV